MPAMSVNLENLFFNEIFGTGGTSKPADLWLALCFSSAAQFVSEVSNLGNTNYVRQNLPFSNWSVTSNTGSGIGIATYTQAIVFPQCGVTAYSTGSPVAAFAVYDAQTKGNIVFYGLFSGQAQYVTQGQTVSIAANSLTITCS